MIPKLLQRWSVKQPTVCRPKSYPFSPDWYAIGEYEFALDNDELVASWGVGFVVRGRPALDWLEGATRRAIETAGFDYEIENIPMKDYYKRRVDIRGYRKTFRDVDTTEALLQSWVKYLEGQ